jgi:hypothetical protein
LINLGQVLGNQIHLGENFQTGVHKRGDSYDVCIEDYIKSVEKAFQDDNEITLEAVGTSADHILDCLPQYTDDEVEERRNGMLSRAVEAIIISHLLKLFIFLTYVYRVMR